MFPDRFTQAGLFWWPFCDKFQKDSSAQERPVDERKDVPNADPLWLLSLMLVFQWL
jgi:hypothetical protein